MGTDGEVDVVMLMLIPAYIMETAASSIELRGALENTEGKQSIRNLANRTNDIVSREICIEPPRSSMKLGLIGLKQYSAKDNEIHTTSRTTGIVFLRMSSSIIVSTTGLSTVRPSVSTLEA
jgi:hypothetical protein